MCREEGVGSFRYRGEWWEYQANQCMASLLLPRRLFIEKTAILLRAAGLESFEKAIRSGTAEHLVRDLASCFDVSHEAVFYRLEAMGFVPKPGQGSLFHSER
jgi:Zn-dependent peptidase ImmA (M78 family)